MRKLFLFLLAPFIFSCGGTSSEKAESVNILENLTFTVDTVIVDLKGEVLNPTGGLLVSDLTKDKTEFWFFENFTDFLVQIDLEQMELIKTIPFEEEGPDGVGSGVEYLKIGSDGELYLSNGYSSGIFNLKGKKLESFKFSPAELDTLLAGNPIALLEKSVFDFDSRKIYSHPRFSDAGDYSFLILDPDNSSARTLQVPKMKIVDDYSRTQNFETTSGTAISFYSVESSITHLPGQIILSNQAMSGFYRFQLQTQEFEFIDIQHREFPNVMDVQLIEQPRNPDEMFENQKKIWEHIQYLKPIWDDSRQLYFRFGMKTFFPEQTGAPHSEYYLFVYDRDFNVLGETKLDGVKYSPWTSFFKNGQLWSFINVNDEPAFAILELDF